MMAEDMGRVRVDVLWPTRPWTEQARFVAEVGFRAAIHAETRPRDLRWFHGLWGRTLR